MDQKEIKDQLIKALQGEFAHPSFVQATQDFPLDQINSPAPNSNYTPYRLLYHLQFAQHDMIHYLKKTEYQAPSWPDDYWPQSGNQATRTDWQKTITNFNRDLQWLIDFIHRTSDLTARLKHREGNPSIFRCLRIIANHNSYHIGEFSILRSIMKTH